ncbi:MAG: PD40 domain-containing protein [Prevotella sp.]|nr:PD40 domain-containing protein [Prevotella sp.]
MRKIIRGQQYEENISFSHDGSSMYERISSGYISECCNSR